MKARPFVRRDDLDRLPLVAGEVEIVGNSTLNAGDRIFMQSPTYNGKLVKWRQTDVVTSWKGYAPQAINSSYGRTIFRFARKV